MNNTQQIKDIANKHAELIKKQRDVLESEYQSLQSEILSTIYQSYDWQTRAKDNARLGKLAIALESLGKAYQTMNTARCN